MGAFEALMIVVIPVGTLAMNLWRKRFEETGKWMRLAYLFVSVFMSTSPMVYIRIVEPNPTALAVILSGLAFFWFALIGSRVAKT